MMMYKAVEQEVNAIRLAIYEETKDMTLEQHKEWLRKIVDAAEKEFGFRRIDNALEKRPIIAQGGTESI
jgi:hypothetical protein